MHYYQHNIGDYRRDTAHLSLLEHGVYRQLLDMYYLSEERIPEETEVVYRRLCAKTNEEKLAVDTVLSEFFKRENGWIHTRCDKEIAEYQGKADRARNNGKLGGRPSKTKVVISGNQEETQTKANHKPINPLTQEPKVIKEKPARAPRKPSADADCVSVDDLIAEGVHPQHATDWLKCRKDKGAKTLTKTAWQAVKDEALKAGLPIPEAVRLCAANNWQGFKASWLDKPTAHGPQSHQPAPLSPLGVANLQNMQNLKQKLLAREQAEQASKGQTHEHEPV